MVHRELCDLVAPLPSHQQIHTHSHRLREHVGSSIVACCCAKSVPTVSFERAGQPNLTTGSLGWALSAGPGPGSAPAGSAGMRDCAPGG